ncbi:ATP-binding protein [Streptomyces sp. NPDC002817]|uniref:ATP-binding protein n=1 Tax=Streptomyces sp. NPDC088357 TaxID=3154655 RepID=UPI00343A04A1
MRTPEGLTLRLRLLPAAAGASAFLSVAAAWSACAAGAVTMWGAAATAVSAFAVVCVAADRWAMRMANTLNGQRAQRDAAVAGATERTEQWLNYFMTMIVESDKGLRLAAEQISRGETPTAPSAGFEATAGKSDTWRDLETALRRSHASAWHLVVNRRQANADMSQVFLYLAGGLFALVVRALKIVTERESTVEDPDTMYDLLDVDSLLRRIRRHAARFAVLGGQQARSVDEPVRLLELLRGAVAEVERYDQVRIDTPKFDVRIPAGGVGPDLIHLLAELIENATKHSRPQNKVTVKASEVQAGLLVEIEDRGLGLADDQLLYFNRLLASPQEGDLAERLAEHQTGLLVVARLAARYKVGAKLERNFFGGTTAYIVTPRALLLEPAAVPPAPATAPPPSPRPGQPAGGPRPSAVVATPPTAPLPQRRAQATASAMPTTDDQPVTSGSKPQLPQRVPQEPDSQRRAAPGPSPGSSALDVHPGFMANFTAGFTGRADEGQAPQPPEEGPQPEDG